jgi:hypothetical protein
MVLPVSTKTTVGDCVPSFALGWKLKEEAFLKDVDVLSDFKTSSWLWYYRSCRISIRCDYPYLAVYETNKDGAYYPTWEKEPLTAECIQTRT